ncbi:MAG: nuclear transport factor 2 family protein [Bradymonadales bacterium]|nr:nuclear transport factor 2 family protein [Bradymonadales bacterium]
MENRLPDVIRRYLQAYNALDIEAMLATLSEDVVFENHTNNGDSIRSVGRAALEILARQTADVFSARSQTVMDAVVESDRVAILVDYKATVARNLPIGWQADQQIEIKGASFFTLRDGLITQIVDLS